MLHLVVVVVVVDDVVSVWVAVDAALDEGEGMAVFNRACLSTFGLRHLLPYSTARQPPHDMNETHVVTARLRDEGSAGEFPRPPSVHHMMNR